MSITNHALLLQILLAFVLSFVILCCWWQTFFLKGYFRAFLTIAFLGLVHFNIWISSLWTGFFETSLSLFVAPVCIIILYILTFFDVWLTPNALYYESLELQRYYLSLVFIVVGISFVSGVFLLILKDISRRQDVEYYRFVNAVSSNVKLLCEKNQDLVFAIEWVAKIEKEVFIAQEELNKMKERVLEKEQAKIPSQNKETENQELNISS